MAVIKGYRIYCTFRDNLTIDGLRLGPKGGVYVRKSGEWKYARRTRAKVK